MFTHKRIDRKISLQQAVLPGGEGGGTEKGYWTIPRGGVNWFAFFRIFEVLGAQVRVGVNFD